MELERICSPASDTNTYLLFTQGGSAVVIDPAADAAGILRRCAEKGAAVHAILLTHGHFDHIGAVAELREKTGAPVMIGAGDGDRLRDGDRELTSLFGLPAPQGAEPDRLLLEGDTITVDELTLTVLSTPGHTPGSVCYQCGALLFTGDTLFAMSIGRTDFPEGNSFRMRQSLDRLAALPENYRVLPGHGGETTLDREKKRNPYLDSKGGGLWY